MIGVMFIILLSIFGYYGFFEAKKMAQKYLADRLAQQKDAETAIIQAMADQTAKSTGVQPTKMSDADFTGMLDKLFVTWGRSKGIIR